MTYQSTITQMQSLIENAGPSWGAIDAEATARMAIQNRFPTGLDIAKYLSLIHI